MLLNMNLLLRDGMMYISRDSSNQVLPYSVADPEETDGYDNPTYFRQGQITNSNKLIGLGRKIWIYEPTYTTTTTDETQTRIINDYSKIFIYEGQFY